MSSLTGTSTAASRAELEKRARAIAAQFYGTECVTVTLSNASVESIQSSSLTTPHESTTTGFTADWEAIEKHRYQHPGYGFPKCTRCGKEDTR